MFHRNKTTGGIRCRRFVVVPSQRPDRLGLVKPNQGPVVIGDKPTSLELKAIMELN